jgi:hypothetical protein
MKRTGIENENLLETLRLVLEDEPKAKAFTRAVNDDRLEIEEIKNYEYMGREKGRDIFKHKKLEMYLD